MPLVPQKREKARCLTLKEEEGLLLAEYHRTVSSASGPLSESWVERWREIQARHNRGYGPLPPEVRQSPLARQSQEMADRYITPTMVLAEGQHPPLHPSARLPVSAARILADGNTVPIPVPMLPEQPPAASPATNPFHFPRVDGNQAASLRLTPPDGWQSPSPGFGDNASIQPGDTLRVGERDVGRIRGISTLIFDEVEHFPNEELLNAVVERAATPEGRQAANAMTDFIRAAVREEGFARVAFGGDPAPTPPPVQASVQRGRGVVWIPLEVAEPQLEKRVKRQRVIVNGPDDEV